jgi:predicted  nucleic acid-binding Zn-ribbon protein
LKPKTKTPAKNKPANKSQAEEIQKLRNLLKSAQKQIAEMRTKLNDIRMSDEERKIMHNQLQEILRYQQQEREIASWLSKHKYEQIKAGLHEGRTLAQVVIGYMEEKSK